MLRLIVCISLAVVVAASLLLPANDEAAAGELDLTGTWTFEVTGHFGIFGQQTLFCTVEIEQTGGDATGDFQCGVANGSATAVITQQDLGANIEADLDLDVSGFPDIDARATGAVSPNGNYIEGDWDADEFSGTFLANRHGAAYLVGDLNCDTRIDTLDALTAIQHAAGVEVSQYPGCPPLESDLGARFADVSCSGSVGAGDALRLLRDRGGIPLPSLEGCPALGQVVFSGE